MFHQNLLQSGERILLLYNFTASTKHYISLEGREQTTIREFGITTPDDDRVLHSNHKNFQPN